MLKKTLLFILLFPLLQACFLFNGPDPIDPIIVENPLPEFVQFPDAFPVPIDIVNEASGMVASRSMPGTLWIIEDGGNPSEIHALSKTGQYLGKITLPFYNRDWEEITMGPGPEAKVNYLYTAEIGDNAEVHNSYIVYRFKEPTSLNEKVKDYELIQFKYSDGKSYDAEALLVDPATKDIYIITKRQFNVNVFKIAYPQNTVGQNTAEFVKSIPYSFITAGDISPDGKEIILKNYDAVYYWLRKDNESIVDALSRKRDVGPAYQREPQGESVCFEVAQKGFFTISEIDQASSVSLYYYGKKIKEN